MPFAEEKTDNRFLKLPKEGDEYDFSTHGDIQSIEKVHNPDGKKGFNFMKRVKMTNPDGKPITVEEDQGYFYRLTFVDGKTLTISSFCPYFALKNAGITEGMSFQMKHPAKGEWIVEVI
jgi:hypothetical protein